MSRLEFSRNWNSSESRCPAGNREMWRGLSWSVVDHSQSVSPAVEMRGTIGKRTYLLPYDAYAGDTG